jgi:hypothetical protein
MRVDVRKLRFMSDGHFRLRTAAMKFVTCVGSGFPANRLLQFRKRAVDALPPLQMS